VHARVGDARTSGAIGGGDVSDARGAFELSPVAAGDVAISCWMPGSSYSDGLRLVTLAPSGRLEVDVPIVRIREDPTRPIGGIGADFDPQSLVPRLYRVLPRGPAGAAGLAEGDVITAVDGTSVTELSPRAVWWLLIDRPPGTTVLVSARRGGRTLTVNLVIGPTDDP
ncbi:MAG: PDZ domain-containing protein, partial [Kofleriaceae bacterium]